MSYNAESSKRWYQKNRTQRLATCKAYYTANKDKKRVYDRVRRANIKAELGTSFSEAKRALHYKNRYGISIAQYDALFLAQDGKCKICSLPSTAQKRKLAVDHDHKTGKVRGLLCDKCNKGLGQFEDNVARLQTAITYLSG